MIKNWITKRIKERTSLDGAILIALVLMILFLALLSFSKLLELIITFQLFFKKYFAVENPIPDEPPVIHITFFDI